MIMSNENATQYIGYEQERHTSVWVRVLATLLIAGFAATSLGALLLFAWFIIALFAWFVIPAGFIYFIIVAIIAPIKRSQAKKNLKYGVPQLTFDQMQAAEFKTGSQTASLAMNIYLSLIAILFPIIYFAGRHASFDDSFSFLLLVMGGALLVAAFYVPFINAPSIYRKQFLQAEEYALQYKTPNYQWIRLNRIWSWIVWSIYGVGVPAVAVVASNGGLRFLDA
jgi:hypothetical protein